MRWLFRKPDKIRVYEQFEGKVSFVDISKLQFTIGYDLPEQYKRFLLKHNGGRIEPDTFNISDNGTASAIQFLYGFTKNINYDIKATYQNWLSHGYPSEYLPIGTDSLGNRILINLKEKNGNIFFWPHDVAEFKLIAISKDFDSF